LRGSNCVSALNTRTASSWRPWAWSTILRTFNAPRWWRSVLSARRHLDSASAIRWSWRSRAASSASVSGSYAALKLADPRYAGGTLGGREHHVGAECRGADPHRIADFERKVLAGLVLLPYLVVVQRYDERPARTTHLDQNHRGRDLLGRRGVSSVVERTVTQAKTGFG